MSILDVKRLDSIDWDFPRAGTDSGSVHSVHWFPGNFIPQIPAALIQVLSRPGDLVFDPFGGSGTTAVEALKLGRNVIVSDTISACVLISEAKLNLVTDPLSLDVRNRLLSQFSFDSLCKSDGFGINGEGSHQELDLWYEAETLAQLRYIWRVIEGQPITIKKQLLALFSNLLFACASTNGSLTASGKQRRHHWGWIADNVRPKNPVNHNAIALFRQRLSGLGCTDNTFPLVHGKVMQQDARHLTLSDNSIDLVVTSPPYIGVIDYTHANRLLYLWMGWSTEQERINEIGARFRRFRKNAVLEYISDMCLARDEIYRVLKKNSYCALVIGESTKFPQTAEKVIQVFSEIMPIVWGPMPRYFSRKRVSDRKASEPVESICVFQKI